MVVDALQPQPLQALALKSGTGGTATTFKSKIKKETVEAVSIAFAPDSTGDAEPQEDAVLGSGARDRRD